MSGHAAAARWPLADTKDGNWMRQIGRQGLYVGRDGVPKDQLATGRPYHETEGNYDPAELPQPTADLDQLRHDTMHDTWRTRLEGNQISGQAASEI